MEISANPKFYFCIKKISSKRFVSWVTPSTGKIYLCTKQTTANYFVLYKYAYDLQWN